MTSVRAGAPLRGVAASDRAARWLSAVGRRTPRRWRRSLQLRVVTTTLVASALVVALIGVLVLDLVTGGLLDTKRSAALAEANSGLRYAEGQLSATDAGSEEALQRTLIEVVRTLSARGSSAGLYDVVILTSSVTREPVASGETDLSAIPADLRKLVTRDNSLAYSYATLTRNGRDSAPGLVVGAPISTDAGVFELYYLFPLSPEADTLSLVRRTLAASGVALVLLLVGVVAIVARQVVTPVQLAARTAERLATGRLHERMAVHGEDDLARLASSFNAMAAGLQAQIGQLEELSRLQRRFTSDVSHELRTPLTTVRMAADVLHAARGDFPPAVARSAELLHAELDRFEALLVDLLEISRYDARAAVLDPEPVDLREVVTRTAAALASLATRQGSELVLRLPATPVVAEADPRRVERVLRNLVDNALEHGEGRPVEVTLAGDAEAVAVTVRDFGVGLRPGEAALVFNRFWRADPSRARTTGGTGLGLSISLEDARLHGGWLQAWGEPGRGCCFRLTLPTTAGGVLTRSPLPLQPPSTPSPAGSRALTATPVAGGSGA